MVKFLHNESLETKRKSAVLAGLAGQAGPAGGQGTFNMQHTTPNIQGTPVIRPNPTLEFLCVTLGPVLAYGHQAKRN